MILPFCDLLDSDSSERFSVLSFFRTLSSFLYHFSLKFSVIVFLLCSKLLKGHFFETCHSRVLFKCYNQAVCMVEHSPQQFIGLRPNEAVRS